MPDFSTTTEDHPPSIPPPARASGPDSFVPGKRVIEGSGVQLATETRWLLQQRLRAASLVLVVGFGLFFLRSLFLHSIDSLAVLFHGLMLGLPLITLSAFSSRWKPTLRQLRAFEVILFALIVVCFMAAQYVLMLKGLHEDNPTRLQSAVKSSVLWMLSMIFTYAIFIPNNWRRAAKVIVPMALAPMVVPWILGMVHPELYQVAIRGTNFDQVRGALALLEEAGSTAIEMGAEPRGSVR